MGFRQELNTSRASGVEVDMDGSCHDTRYKESKYMPALPILIGAEEFRELRERSCYYVDKTSIIEKLFSPMPPKVSNILRPRRFGKTLTMTMLRDFFDIRQDSKTIFEGLAISQNKELCDAGMNKYPTVFLTLKGVEGLTFAQVMEQMKMLVSRLCIDFAFLLESPAVYSRDRQILSALKSRNGTLEQTENFLDILFRALQAHYGKSVILLIDEYDVPLAKAQENGYYREMVSFLRCFLGCVLKTNPSLEFAVLTGGLHISRESIFTGLNNFCFYGSDRALFADKIGFTNEDVDALLEQYGIADRKPVVQEWYGGYRFGNNVEMYCPWDVLQYVVDAQSNPAAVPQAYWNNSSGNAIIRSFVGRTDLNIGDKFEALLAGGCVEASIVDDLTYDSLHTSEDNLWTLLYLTGYLTKARPEQMEQCGILPGGRRTPLVIPNKEVREIFITSISTWFTESMHAMDRRPLFEAFWRGDSEGFRARLSRILLTTISYHDYHEHFYHAVLADIFVGSGYAVASNLESGRGRADIIIKDTQNARAAIIEVKRARAVAELPELTDAAIHQIREKEYAVPLIGLYEEIILWGMTFYEKRCSVRAERLSP